MRRDHRSFDYSQRVLLLSSLASRRLSEKRDYCDIRQPRPRPEMLASRFAPPSEDSGLLEAGSAKEPTLAAQGPAGSSRFVPSRCRCEVERLPGASPAVCPSLESRQKEP